MTDETRILRTVGIPIIIAVVLLFMIPKMCARAVTVTKARQESQERPSSGLHIESSQKPAQPVSYPAGLDPDRIRYLIEIDNGFATPHTAHLLKAPHLGATPIELRLLPALRKLGYMDIASDGTPTLTRDGLLHLDGLVDDGASWTFPLAKRQFDSVTSVDNDGSTAHAAFTWKWQPNAVGEELLNSPRSHNARAELRNVGDHWSLGSIAGLDNELN